MTKQKIKLKKHYWVVFNERGEIRSFIYDSKPSAKKDFKMFREKFTIVKVKITELTNE